MQDCQLRIRLPARASEFKINQNYVTRLITAHAQCKASAKNNGEESRTRAGQISCRFLLMARGLYLPIVIKYYNLAVLYQ